MPLVVNSTSAFLSDVEQSNNNFFNAGSIVLGLRDGDGNLLTYPLFSILGMNPNDLQSKTVKVTKEGTLDFQYSFQINQTGEDSALCNILTVDAKLDGVSKYNGNLLELNFSPAIMISETSDDWNFLVSFNSSDPSLQLKTCSFDLVVKGWQSGSDGTWGLTDTKTLTNTISYFLPTIEPIPALSTLVTIATQSAELNMSILEDKKTVSFSLNNISDFKKISYQLSYDSDNESQGIIGEADLNNQVSFEMNNITLGTCSGGGTCVYHQNVHNFQLSVDLTDNKDKVIYLLKSIE